MNKGIVMALIIAGAILLAAAAMIYFSPFQTCVRALVQSGHSNDFDAKMFCASRER